MKQEGELKREDIRTPIMMLAFLMERKMREREPLKSPWENETQVYLFSRLLDEITELSEAIKTGEPLDIANECADIGNFAMMIVAVAATAEAQRERMGGKKRHWPGQDPWPVRPSSLPRPAPRARRWPP